MTTVVLVHGAWHGPWCWDEVVAGLEAQGFRVVAPELSFSSLGADAATVSAVLDAEEGPFMVCGHSYGGAVISAATSGRTDIERLVYLCAFQTEVDQLASPNGGALIEALQLGSDGVTVDPAKIPAVFYADCSPEQVERAMSQLRPMPIGGEQQPVPGPAGWHAIPSTYVVCTQDESIPPAQQREMAANATDVVELEASHSPFFSRPDDVVAILAKAAGQA